MLADMARQRAVVGIIAAARTAADQEIDLPASIECFDGLRQGRRLQECSHSGASDDECGLAANSHERSLMNKARASAPPTRYRVAYLRSITEKRPFCRR